MKINSIVGKISSINNFNNYPDAVIIIDSLNNIKQWNKKACEIFGYNQKEIFGRNIAIIFDSEVEKFQEALKSGQVVVVSAKNSSDEDIFVEISCKDLSKKKKILITARDVTRNQKVIENLLYEYEKAVKISTQKNNFITGLSNEFKAPIHSFLGFSQGLLDQLCGELNEKQFKYVSIMNKNANSLLNLVNDFLELSRLEKEDFTCESKVFDLPETINQVCEKLKIRAEAKGLQFIINTENLSKKNIYSNSEFLGKIIFNLVENAVKFTETGYITIKVQPPEENFVKKRGLRINESFSAKSWLLFSITDTGIGISQEDIDLIFDEYSNLERNLAKKHGGTGFKLALTKKMVSCLGGVIWVDSEPSQGSIFSFAIPVERPANTEPDEEIQEIPLN